LKYNLYLIEEYKKFLLVLIKYPKIDERTRVKIIKTFTTKLNEIENLLIDNNGDNRLKIFNVNDWEENLREYYSTLNKIINLQYS
jgi:hypothetical protein